jgi:poly-gamma-glutamate synthesis protein (capsule biosynthesis protein)
MDRHLLLVGDVGLCGFEQASIPLEFAAPVLRRADVLFGNLECVLSAPPSFSADPPCEEPVHPGAGAETRVGGRRRLGGWDSRFSFMDQDGLFAEPVLGEALVLGGFHAVGCANNQTYGPEQILASLGRLDALGVAHTGAGVNREAARRPAIVARNGLKVGFLQYTSVYWPSNHEAGLNYPGVAVIKGYTSYQPITEYPIGNRPGVPPMIKTWADVHHVAEMQADIRRLRAQVDVVVSSHHWGFLDEVFEYQEEIAHAAIDAGADIVVGHGPHQPLAIEVYRGRPVFYGLGNFAFKHRHWRSTKGAIDAGVSGKDAWIGILVDVTHADGAVREVAFRPVRHNERLQTMIRTAADDRALVDRIAGFSAVYGTQLDVGAEKVVVRI